jgi:predicted nucleic acid-binding Zn finger protein
VEIYGERGKKALLAVKGGRVKKKGKLWVVEGKTDEYEIVGDLCYCMDYALNIVTGRAGVDMCYHVLAKKIAEILDERGR